MERETKIEIIMAGTFDLSAAKSIDDIDELIRAQLIEALKRSTFAVAQIDIRDNPVPVKDEQNTSVINILI